MPAKDEITEALRQVVDPELQIDIVALGLLYNIDIDSESNVNILMTLTYPGCPYGAALIDATKQVASKVPGVKGVDVKVTFEPPWQPTEEIKTMLGVF